MCRLACAETTVLINWRNLLYFHEFRTLYYCFNIPLFDYFASNSSLWIILYPKGSLCRTVDYRLHFDLVNNIAVEVLAHTLHRGSPHRNLRKVHVIWQQRCSVTVSKGYYCFTIFNSHAHIFLFYPILLFF